MKKKLFIGTGFLVIVGIILSLVIFGQKTFAENKNIEYYYNVMIQAFENENWKKLDEVSEFVLKNFTPKADFAFFYRGVALHELGDYEGAIASYTSVIKIHPTAEAYQNRGYTYLMDKQYNKAIADYDMALKLNPKEANAKIQREIAVNAKQGFIVTKQGNVTNYQSINDPAYLVQEYKNMPPLRKKHYIDLVKSYSKDVLPIYYIAVADDVYKEDKNLAAFLFMAGRFRTLGDALACQDDSAIGIVGMTGLFAPNTSQYFEKMSSKKRAKLIQEVLDWDLKYPDRPNPKWVCYHGITAFMGNKSVKTVSAKKYKELRQVTREKAAETVKQILKK